MLQSLIQRLQASDMVRPFNTLYFFRNTQFFGKVYYQLYADDYEIPSKAANDPEEPSLGRIRADSIAPPHTPTSIKLCISRVEENPTLIKSDLFMDTTCDSPLKEGYISILHTDGPGRSPNKPMAIVQADVQVEIPLQVEVTSVPDGRYLIKNRAADIYWGVMVEDNPSKAVYFFPSTMEIAKNYNVLQVKKHSPIISVLLRIILF